MYEIKFEENKIRIVNALNFGLAQTLDCGQAFRWEIGENGHWSGIAKGKYIELYEENRDIIIEGSNKEDFENIWYDYFDLERDYSKIITAVSENETVSKAAAFGSGIRILNQEPWETLCSFIISQNNNIPRIKGIINRLCENFGNKTEKGYTFPSAETIANLSLDELAPIKSGFRAKYILDAARKVSSGELDLNKLKSENFETAREALMTVKGVGPKVADCTLLFSLGKIEAFPRDVWIKRAMEELFAGELPESSKPYAGIVQQYIFYYARSKNI